MGDKLAVRSCRCVPLGGLKACPLGTFEILDAFSCNLVHILSKKYFFYLYSVDERGGVRPPPPTPPGSAPGGQAEASAPPAVSMQADRPGGE